MQKSDSSRRGRRRGEVWRRAAVIVLIAASPLAAQPRQPVPLSLEEAIVRALAGGEEITAARAGIMRAEGNQTVARSGYWPQITASLSYTRTLMSQYSSLSSSSGGGDTGSSGGSLSSIAKNLPFGRENQYTFAITLVQSIFTGGRLDALTDAADARRRAAEINLTSTQASQILDVTKAYLDALLARELVVIADSSLAQSEELLRQTELGFRVGARAEFEVLRARVARDNQLPLLIERRNTLQLALLRLKQLVEVPMGDSLELTSGVEVDLPRFATPADTSAAMRAPVREAEANIVASRAQVRAAVSERWPQVALTSRFAPVAYPDDPLPSLDDFRTDWTVGLSVSMPLFTGWRIDGNVKAAEGTLLEAEARTRQLREAASLDARMAVNDLEQARATLAAVESTVEQARRAFEIARVRFREGLSTQLELSDTRLLLEQASVNRARAVRNYQVARARLALLPDLPIGTSSGPGSSGAGAGGMSQGAPAQGGGAMSSPQGSDAGGGAPGGAVTGGGIP